MEIGVKPDPVPGATTGKSVDAAKKFPNQSNKLTNYFSKPVKKEEPTS
jgi:hypothetical protein